MSWIWFLGKGALFAVATIVYCVLIGWRIRILLSRRRFLDVVMVCGLKALAFLGVGLAMFYGRSFSGLIVTTIGISFGFLGFGIIMQGNPFGRRMHG